MGTDAVFRKRNALVVHLYIIVVIVYELAVIIGHIVVVRAEVDAVAVLTVPNADAVPANVHPRAVLVRDVDAVREAHVDAFPVLGFALLLLILLLIGDGDILLRGEERVERYAVELREHYEVVRIGGGFRPLPLGDRLAGDAELFGKLLLRVAVRLAHLDEPVCDFDIHGLRFLSISLPR